MHRFYLPPEQCQSNLITLDQREAHHGLHVLRLRQGERVCVLDGAGHEYLCEVQSLARDAIQLAVVQPNFVPALPYRITLLQALLKGKGFETIVQKATELGVSRIVPMLSERVVAQLDHDHTAHKLEKWRVTTIEALKQSGNPWLPEITAPRLVKDQLAKNESQDLTFIASLQPGSRHPREYFRDFFAARGNPPRSVSIWVGPEGDFTPAETNAVVGAGALPITLGRLVLRSETAALYSLSVLNYELQARWP